MCNADITISEAVLKYKRELQKEFSDILLYWESHVVDNENGGFYGSVNFKNKPDKNAAKGVVLNSRILWTFSRASLLDDFDYGHLAKRAYEYITAHFIDRESGGVYWSLNADGTVKNTRKQIYGIAFCIYGLAEYYKLTKEKEALRIAVELFESVEKYARDHTCGGYIEALSKDWDPVADLRLSEKDGNEKKTMNTHLHIIEAYANLYDVWSSERLRKCIESLLDAFEQFIIDKNTGHLHLFMDEKWHVKSSAYSFGHEIEASWLLLECAEIIRDQERIKRFKQMAVTLATAASEGLAGDGALYYELNTSSNIFLKEKHWWSQAEAMVGFFNAGEITGVNTWMLKSFGAWRFIKNNLKDKKGGEWYWGVDGHYRIMEEDKASFWKCPYHNARACMEIIKRIKNKMD